MDTPVAAAESAVGGVVADVKADAPKVEAAAESVVQKVEQVVETDALKIATEAHALVTALETRVQALEAGMHPFLVKLKTEVKSIWTHLGF